MKYLLTLFSLCTFTTFAQHDPNFNTDGFTPFWNNPAATGAWNKFSVNATYQNEWPTLMGKSQSVNLSTELDMIWGKNVSDKKFNMPLGLNAMYQINGPQEILRFHLPISVPINIGESTIALGLAPGIRQVSTDWTQIPFNDPVLITNGTAFDLNAGLFWYGKNHYAGLSMTNAIAPVIDGLPTERHVYAQGGYRFKVGKHYLFPMVSASYVDGFYGLQAMSYFQFKEDIFSVGVGYGLISDLKMAATVSFKSFKLAYAYSWNLNKLTTSSIGDHEVRLSYTIPKLFDKNSMRTSNQ